MSALISCLFIVIVAILALVFHRFLGLAVWASYILAMPVGWIAVMTAVRVLAHRRRKH